MKKIFIIMSMLIALSLFACADAGDIGKESDTENDESESMTEAGTDIVTEENKENVFILLYHHLVEDELAEGQDPGVVTTKEKFISDIDGLLENGYISLSLEDYYAKKYDDDKKYFILTFDDGYLSNYEIAYPIMLENKLYGSIFACTDKEKLDNHFKWEQGREMEASGYITIYSHSADHKKLTDCESTDAFVSGIVKSHADIVSRLGEREFFFSYPNSDYSVLSVKSLFEAGVKMQFVQWIYADNEEIAWRDYGIVRRLNISNDVSALDTINDHKMN